MPLQATSGAASYDAFGGGVPAVPNYIEEVFSTYLYTGNASSLTITNGIDLSTKGGLIWFKNRQNGDQGHVLVDTLRGQYGLTSNATVANEAIQNGTLSFNSNGFAFSGGLYTGSGDINGFNNDKYVSWTFRKQPKFFDVVTYTGTGSNTTIAHSLGAVPACIMVKRTDTTGNWQVYHRSLANTEYLVLNSTAAKATGATRWNSTTPTSTVFSLGTDTTVNASGGTYVAYIYAHDAGGFGLTGTDNVISCGSFTGGSNVSVTLGYEPQWLLTKKTNEAGGGWNIFDTMRGWDNSGSDQILQANTSGAEIAFSSGNPTATGFNYSGDTGNNIIYIAIRRGPMKVPTLGTSVFKPVTRTGTDVTTTVTTAGFPVDGLFIKNRDSAQSFVVADRLRGQPYLRTAETTAETTTASVIASTVFQVQNGYITGTTASLTNESPRNYVDYFFRRAPSFFDEVCYTGTGSATTFTHNLGVVPELIITKVRAGGPPDFGWAVYASPLGATKALFLDTTDAEQTLGAYWNDTAPTSSVFTVGNANKTNRTSYTYVAYLFATCAGVSKVGSYTGTATTKQIDCGFTGGARFVLIKRTDSTGDWYVWDSARGIVSGNDPYLLLNSTAAEVTSTDYIDTYSAGFEISSTAPAAINASGGTFVFLAIA